ASPRFLEEVLQVALPARPGLVRPPAVHPVSRTLAGVLAEGQDRRLALDVRARDGARLLDLHRVRSRGLRRRRVAGGGFEKWNPDDVAAETFGARDGDVGFRFLPPC